MLQAIQVNVKTYLKSALALVIFSLLFLLSFGFYQIQPALAHRPHDVVERVELSPNYEQDNTVFIFVRNNFFKSTDKGQNWTRLTKGLDYRNELSDIVVSRENKQILFISSLGDGVYKSRDEGSSWEKVNQGLNNLQVEKLVISPSSSNIVLAVAEKELYKTTNEGKNWSKIFTPNQKITALTFLPSQNKKLLLGDEAGELYLSEDEGVNWQKINTIKDSGTITKIAFSPQFEKDKTFFVGTEKGGVYKTVDGGKTFEKLNQGLTDVWIRDLVVSNNYPQDSTVYAITWSEAIFDSKDGGKTWKQHNQGIVKDPQADDLKTPHFTNLKIANNSFYLGGFNGLFQSTDGHSWQELETLSTGSITALGISPNYGEDGTVAIVNYVGMPYISRDQGVNWEAGRKGLELPRFTKTFKKLESEQDARRFFDVVFSPNYAQDKTIFASVLWTNIVKSTDGGKSWKIIYLPQEVRGMTIVPSPNFSEDKTVYVASQQDVIFKSTDGGESFTKIGKVGDSFSNYSPSLVVSPDFASDKTVFVTGDKGVYKTVDGGQAWTAMTEGKPLSERGEIRLVISPNYKVDKTVLAGTDKGVFISRDGGENWEVISKIQDEVEPLIAGIAISPNYQNDQTWMVSIRGKGLYKTVDDGQSFSKIGNDLITLSTMTSVPSAGKALQFSPAYATDNTLFGFGAANTQVYRSTDGGNKWEAFPVTLYKETGYDLLTSADLAIYVYRSYLARILVSLVSAIAAYIILGYLALEKKLPLKRWQIKLLGTFIVFVFALFVAFKIL